MKESAPGSESRRRTVETPCRSCSGTELVEFLDLGLSPLANSYVAPDRLDEGETFFPLRVSVCPSCWLVQVPEFRGSAEIFSDYAYFSSFAESWVAHAERCVAEQCARFGWNERSLVIEVASNDGYLLSHVRQRGIPCLGIEPAHNVARVAEEAAVPTVNRFLDVEVARAVIDGSIDPNVGVGGRPFGSTAGPLLGRAADWVVANNVFAHTPDLRQFAAALRELLAPRGVLTIEVQHLERLLQEIQFDTVYHEHFQYYSLFAAQRLLGDHGLVVFDVEQLPTHGGSLRIFCRRDDAPPDDRLVRRPAVDLLLRGEREAGILDLELYGRFGEKVVALKRGLLRFLLDAQERGERVVAYGAPAKGNTLLNYCGVGPDLVSYTVDRNPHKQGCLLPGTRIPICDPQRILEDKPDWVLILPWNLKEEIARQMVGVKSWGGRFVVAVPTVQEVQV